VPPPLRPLLLVTEAPLLDLVEDDAEDVLVEISERETEPERELVAVLSAASSGTENAANSTTANTTADAS
jgi:hypothetical protein